MTDREIYSRLKNAYIILWKWKHPLLDNKSEKLLLSETKRFIRDYKNTFVIEYRNSRGFQCDGYRFYESNGQLLSCTCFDLTFNIHFGDTLSLDINPIKIHGKSLSEVFNYKATPKLDWKEFGF